MFSIALLIEYFLLIEHMMLIPCNSNCCIQATMFITRWRRLFSSLVHYQQVNSTTNCWIFTLRSIKHICAVNIVPHTPKRYILECRLHPLYNSVFQINIIWMMNFFNVLSIRGECWCLMTISSPLFFKE